MTEHDERDLGERFHALRREDAAAAPAFRATLTATLAGPRHRRSGGAAVATALALIALVLLLTLRGRHRATVDLASVRLHTPTDFLLQVPGEELLRTVPTFTLDGRLLQ
ncbi:MAG TPA: hypothetical protein VIV88_15135 [Gemmatimonadales bacterium]|jgi:hypothetical protein